MNFSITVDGQQKFSQAIGRLEGLVTDWRKVWPLCAEIFYRIEVDQFASEGSRGPAGKWAPLSQGYAKWKRVNYGELPTLYLTGALKNSLTGTGPGAIRIETESSLTLGTSVNRKGFSYPRALQQGTPKMPARPPIDIGPNDYGKFVSRVFRFFNDNVAATGFTPSKSAGATKIQGS